MTAPEATQDAVKAYEHQQQQQKEYNFAQLNEKLKRAESARIEAEKRADEAEKQAQVRHNTNDDDEDDIEPYVDHKKLKKQFNSFEKNMEVKIHQEAEVIARNMIEKEKQDSYLKRNADFYETINNYAEKFRQQSPELAENILSMPNTFERLKLVYSNIKALGIDKPSTPQPSIQDKIDANRRSPYYQPSGVATAPYSMQGDYSEAGKKAAHDKMKALQTKLRLG
jgi:hypothetical protein